MSKVDSSERRQELINPVSYVRVGLTYNDMALILSLIITMEKEMRELQREINRILNIGIIISFLISITGILVLLLMYGLGAHL